MTKTGLPYKTAGDLRPAGDPSHAIDDSKKYRCHGAGPLDAAGDLVANGWPRPVDADGT